MLQTRGDPDLPLEPLGVDAGAHLRRQDLDDDLTRKPRLLGEEDAAHPTTPELLQDVVGVTYGSLNPGLEADPAGSCRGMEASYIKVSA